MEFNENKSKDFEVINIKELLFRLLSYWKLYVVTVVISIVVSYIINRYATNIYSISTTINIKESENPLSSSSLNLMFKWGGTSELMQSRIAVLKSKNHNLKVIDRLNLEVEYFSAGRVKLVKNYGKSPYRVIFDKSHNQIYGLPFEIALRKEGGFKLIHEEEKKINIIDYSSGDVHQVPSFKISGDFQFDSWITNEYCKFKIVADTSEVKFSNEFTLYFQFQNPKLTIGGYLESLVIEEISDGGSLLRVSMKGENKSKLIDYLNTSIELLKEYELEEKNQLAENTITFVDNQLLSVKDTLESVENELERYRVDNEVVDLGTESSALYDSYLSLETQRAEIDLSQKYYDYLFNYLEKQDDYSSIMAPSVVGIEDPVLHQLIQRLVELSVERNRLLFSLESGNPVLEQTNREIILTRNSLKENVGNLIKATRIRTSDINTRLNDMKSKLAELPNTEQQLINIRRKYELSSTQYDFLIQKRAEAELLKAGNLPDVQIIDVAEDYGDLPIKPKKALNLAIGLFFGFLFPTIFILLRIFFNSKLESKLDLERSTSIPIIGTIGHSSGLSNIVILNGLKSSVAESFRIIRTNLNFIFNQSIDNKGFRSKVILVTSSVGGEGKTFCSINLSSIISISGAKTIIVGLDMRKPKIFNDFKLNNDTGLSEYLSNQVGIDKIIKPTEVADLDFITAGPVPPNPGELLMSPRLDELMDKLKAEYEFIILDTPPITLVSDALELMKYADATLYVTRQNYTNRELLSVINEQYEKRGVKNISIIFNDVIKSAYGYDYGYGYGYGYYDEDDTKLPWWKRVI